MVIATGFFDGVHLGHRFVIRQLVEAARTRGVQSCAVTFWPHPRTVLQNDARTLRLLSSLDEKKKMLMEFGVDRVEVLPFTKEFAALSAEEYLREYVRDRFGGTAVLVGYDNRMGSDQADPETIRGICHRLGMDAVVLEKVSSGSITISSTKIRGLLSGGDVADASEMLGYDYPLFGVVVAGDRIGRSIGFPTANMQLYEPLKLVPGRGVYLVGVETLGRKFHGMCNIGFRPTVSEREAMTIETNIFDFDEDIYGLDIRVSFLEKIRDEIRFESMEALRAQLCEDRKNCLSRI